MRYTIVNNKLFRINDDGTLTEKVGVDVRTGLMKGLRQHVEKEVKDDKIKKDKEKEDKDKADKEKADKEKADKEKEDKDNKPKNKVVIESIDLPKKKKGRPKKEKSQQNG